MKLTVGYRARSDMKNPECTRNGRAAVLCTPLIPKPNGAHGVTRPTKDSRLSAWSLEIEASLEVGPWHLKPILMHAPFSLRRRDEWTRY